MARPLRAFLDGFLRAGSTSRSGGPSGGSGTHVGTGPSGLSGIMGGTIEFVFTWAAPIAVILGLAIVAWTLLDRQLTEYAIVSSPYSGAQVYKISGVLRRQTISVPLPVINNLVLDEPLLGRLFGWGHLGIETGNDYDGDNLVFVPKPRGFHSAYQKFRKLYFGRSDLGDLSRGAGAQAPWRG